MRLALLLLCSACSFSVPRSSDAIDACVAWFAACREKTLKCGLYDEAEAGRVYEYWVDRCQRATLILSSKVYGQCIPDLEKATCEGASDVECNAFVGL